MSLMEERERENRLLNLLEQLPDEILEEAAETEDRKAYEELAETGHKKGPCRNRYGWKRWGIIAACLCAVVVGKAVWNSTGQNSGWKSNTSDSVVPVTAAGNETGASGGTGAPPAAAAQGSEEKRIDFLYGGWLYAEEEQRGDEMLDNEPAESSLPEGCRLLGYLRLNVSGRLTGDLETSREELEGMAVYGEGKSDGETEEGRILYVETGNGYRRYLPCLKQR